jgi:putative endonuclease
MQHIELGQLGEELAAKYLTAKKIKILDRNYRWGKSEIDIVCKQDEFLVVIEVKTRQTEVYGQPYEAVTRSKQRQIIKVTNQYIKENQIDLEVRFDVVSIIKNQFQTKIDHIEGAFYPLG